MPLSASLSGFVNELEHDRDAIETAFKNDVHALVEKYDEFVHFARVTTSAGESDVRAAVTTASADAAKAEAIATHDATEAEQLAELDAAGIKTVDPEPAPDADEKTAPEASDTPS
jgi:hypothetical protein